MNERKVEQVVDLVDADVNRVHNMSVEEARARVACGLPEAVAGIDGSFALVARDGDAVRLARSMDRPLRYFLAKRSEGPALVASDRIDAIHDFLEREGLGGQFHPSYTRMVPAHHVVEVRFHGILALHAPASHRGRGRHPLRGADGRRPPAAVRAERRHRLARRPSPDGTAHAGLSQAPLPAWRPAARRASTAIPVS